MKNKYVFSNLKKNFAKFTGRQFCFPHEGLPLYQKETPIHVFFCELCEMFMKTYFAEYLPTASSVKCKTKKEHFHEIYLGKLRNRPNDQIHQ